jgi:hypothetical protein
MRFIILVLTFIGGHLLFFFTLSLIGLLWVDSYKAIISNGNWFMFYTLLIGIWVGVFVARSYYLIHEPYFKRFF